MFRVLEVGESIKYDSKNRISIHEDLVNGLFAISTPPYLP